MTAHHQKEIDRRRTCGIISHPDAGKTTLTEKLLLFGGAIQQRGGIIIQKELDITMALCGLRDVNDLSRDNLLLPDRWW